MSKRNLKELEITPYRNIDEIIAAGIEDNINSLVLKSPCYEHNAYMYYAAREVLLKNALNITSVDFTRTAMLETKESSGGRYGQEKIIETMPMNEQTQEFVQFIAEKCPNLTTLKLGSANLDSKSLEIILKSINTNAIEYLDISDNNLYSIDLNQMLHALPSIQCIKIDGSNISKVQISALKEIAPKLFDAAGYEARCYEQYILESMEILNSTLEEVGIEGDLIGLVDEYYNDVA